MRPTVTRHGLPRDSLKCAGPRDFAREAHQVADLVVQQVRFLQKLLRPRHTPLGNEAAKAHARLLPEAPPKRVVAHLHQRRHAGRSLNGRQERRASRSEVALLRSHTPIILMPSVKLVLLILLLYLHYLVRERIYIVIIIAKHEYGIAIARH